METKLLYMEHSEISECFATVTDVLHDGENTTIVLDQTIFYPQGGGQPYDTGTIKTEDDSAIFNVTEVRFVDGTVHHKRAFESGTLTSGMHVVCAIDKVRRALHARLHSAGHVVDLALKELNIDWIAGKGYHFPEGAYVEYVGSLGSFDIEALKADLEKKCNEIIQQNIDVTIAFDEDTLQNEKPRRTVYYGDFGIPCGGTHVANLSDIGALTIRKIKKEKENIRVSYTV
jgi:Ser-tRNA(Ala) deacylase AlaX